MVCISDISGIGARRKGEDGGQEEQDVKRFEIVQASVAMSVIACGTAFGEMEY